jgi:NAD(P)-dependent dehydrogenase (short-subunit alcohol dehydrogenase family)
MKTKTILILGGYGNTGRPLAKLLLQETDVQLILAGRSLEKAESAAAEFNRSAGQRVVGIAADASDPIRMRQVLQGVDLLVVASSTVCYAQQVATAALEAGADYLDVQFSTQKVAMLKAMAGEIEKAGRCFITDGGFHPGLPAALVRYVAPYFDILEKANVGSVIKVDWAALDLPDATINELLEEINDFEALLFKDSAWKKARMSGMADYLRMDFSGEFGGQACMPMFLEEMRSIPEHYPSLKETGFFVGGFNWFVDWLVMPLGMVGLRLWPQRALGPLGKLMKWGLNKFSRPPYGTLLKVEAEGIQDHQAKSVDVILSHPDGYLFTAIPVAACLLQYLDGTIRMPGLWTQANLVEPNRLMKDMQRMGIELRMQERTGLIQS